APPDPAGARCAARRATLRGTLLGYARRALADGIVLRTDRDGSSAMKPHGWVGLVILAGGEGLLYAGVPLVATFFTPLMWTGYLLLVDGWVAARVDASWLTTRRREFGFLALLSV